MDSAARSTISESGTPVSYTHLAPNKSKAPLFILIGIAAAVVLVIVLLLRGCGGAAYEKPVKVMLDTMISGKYDMKTAQKLSLIHIL